ncbi:2-oxoacid ferredoxin oxidoreductase [Paramagnetospirillum caucaseum]|uniref:2-oxoacid ferredoxin oxidoreductase n=1 Tax=Paramagnetospirillum caucaseum TaxID=1244869 RepID=M2Z7L1_9PROT|nr:indolepyruvate ferredoxin oxidoreductase family protein [Paramagnetospirillum caucaseum]EME70310.1 2-oxoacid ferredoxin oxidoreductase [Paramagnetospirillum caucaseum]
MLSGTQALIDILFLQAERDRRSGLRTAGFVSGYRGSPLGGLDQALWRRQPELEAKAIRFLPAINEELAVAAVQGSQQTGIDPEATVDGVFAMWYGKGPGVDRASDAFRHAHAFGSSPQGGVLVVVGDDHGGVSTSFPQQSEPAMIGWRMPVLNPADIRDYFEFGLYGYALSRFSGGWVGFKAISECVEATVCTRLPDLDHRYAIPDFAFPADGVHIRWPDYPSPAIEERLLVKQKAVLAFARANPLDRRVMGDERAWLGIVATGKAFRDLQEALRLLGIDEDEAARIGLRVYKVGLSYPLESEGLLDFAAGLELLLVVEERLPVVETQIKELFYNAPRDTRPVILGKSDEAGAELLPEIAEIRPWRVARALAACLSRRAGMERFVQVADGLVPVPPPPPVKSPARRPYFCSGCPHSSSTRIPAGSRGQAGVGCHVMACWMDRDTAFITQMGGEGANWVGQSTFTAARHVFQNLGDGTYYHSGSLAVRQAVAAKANITYKILVNGAVAMTGGQAVDGPLTVAAITHQVRGEGVGRIAVVSDSPARHDVRDFAAGTTLHHRRDIEAVQLELRDIPGVTVLVYDQLCATEKRRREKRGKMAPPARHAVINDAVCDGCGDCGKVSNCLSIVPRLGPFGLKRMVDQTSCNKDMTCVEGYCPSFVTVVGGRRRKPAPDRGAARIANLPPPAGPARKDADILFAGIGGTGVVTVARVLAKAAELEGKGISVLDFTGFAQKGGAVLSHLRIVASGQPHQARIAAGQCDVLIACDLVVACGNDPVQAIGRHRTRIVANTHVAPTGDFTRHPGLLPDGAVLAGFLQARADGALTALDASGLADRLFGSNVMANMILLGAAFQQGLLPVPLAALEQAIAGMEAAAEDNRLAFGAGRLAIAEPGFAAPDGGGDVQAPAELPARVEFFAAHLADRRGAAQAGMLKALVRSVHEAESAVMPGASRLAGAVAAGYAHLLADKDEYEVARQLSDEGFLNGLRQDFEGPWRLEFHFAHPWISRWRKGKLTVPEGVALPLLRLLARAGRLRGTVLDPFRFGRERRNARRLAAQYEADIAWVLARLTPATYEAAIQLAELPDGIRGYGRVREGQAEAAAIRRQTLLDSIATEAPGLSRS